MNYNDIVELALSYADRQDLEVTSKMDSFLKIVEARINRVLTVRKMALRTQLIMVKDQEYYGLPSDFVGLRDIEIQNVDDANARTTLHYKSPEQMNEASRNRNSIDGIYYTIIADQLQVIPPQDGAILEIIYYQALPPLNNTSTQENWLSLSNPDCYIFGLLVEISSFVKDVAAKELWDARFQQELASIVNDDAINRWSGTALQVRLG